MILLFGDPVLSAKADDVAELGAEEKIVHDDV